MFSLAGRLRGGGRVCDGYCVKGGSVVPVDPFLAGMHELQDFMNLTLKRRS